ncbi:MAG: endonuclease III [Candidatus Nanohaloarchaea archaeon]
MDDIREINRVLREEYGEPEEPVDQSGVDYLIETILSQNTNDVNRDKAFDRLNETFDSYREIEEADREELIDAIRVAGLGPTKAERIQNALEIIREDQGEYSLDFIGDMDVEDGKEWLTRIPGIGPKTAAIILCFHFRKPVIPVDTHVHRVSKRLGLIPEDASRKKAHRILEEKVPDGIKYGFHRLLITHGRETCTARNPDCRECVLKNHCRYYEEVIEGDRTPEEFG